VKKLLQNILRKIPAVRSLPGASVFRSGSKPNFRHKYPRSCSDFSDVEQAAWDQLFQGFAPSKPLLRSGCLALTLGSCFAENISSALRECGVRTFVGRMHEEANSPVANELMLRALLSPADRQERNVFREEISPSAAESFRAALSACEAVIVTVGVGIVCLDKASGNLVLRPNSREARDATWRFLSVPEAKKAMEGILGQLRLTRQDLPVIFTVSPVPLFRSFLTPSAFNDDCISKSLLRTAVEELMRSGLRGIYYWPAFELFRWLGGHLPPVFGADDDLPRHPNKDLVRIATRAFVRAFVKAGDREPVPADSEGADLIPDHPPGKE